MQPTTPAPGLPCAARDRELTWPLGAIAFLSGGLATLLQSYRGYILWDWTFNLEVVHRLGLGQRPYVDFVFPYPPLSFLGQWLFASAFGESLAVSLIYILLLSGASTWLASRWLLLQVPDLELFTKVAVVIACALANPYAGMATPYYDSDLCLVLLAICNLLTARRTSGFVAAGVATATLPFIKQNAGLALTTALVGWELLASWRRWRDRQSSLAFFAGLFAVLVVACLALEQWVGWESYIENVLVRPAHVRLNPSSLAWWMQSFLLPPTGWAVAGVGLVLFVMAQRHPRLADFVDFVWPGALVFGVILSVPEVGALRTVTLVTRSWCALPFLFLLCALADVALGRPVRAFAQTSFLLVIAYLAASVSLGWESLRSYALLLLVATTSFLRTSVRRRAVEAAGLWAVLAAAVVLFVAQDRLDSLAQRHYAALSSPFDDVRARTGPLATYIAQNLGPEESFVVYPGEEPVFFLTGRVPRFPVVAFDWSFNPFDFDRIVATLDRLGIRTIFVQKETAYQLSAVNGGIDFERYTFGKKLLALERAELVAETATHFVFRLSSSSAQPACPGAEERFAHLRALMRRVSRPEELHLAEAGLAAGTTTCDKRRVEIVDAGVRRVTALSQTDEVLGTTFEDQLGRPIPEDEPLTFFITIAVESRCATALDREELRLRFNDDPLTPAFLPMVEEHTMAEVALDVGGFTYTCRHAGALPAACSCRERR